MKMPAETGIPIRPSPARYELKVKGLIPGGWADWFEGFEILPLEDGTTLLVGAVVDQAGLHGVLVKIRDFNLELLSVNRLDKE